MIIASYNQPALGDVLMILTAPQKGASQYQQTGDLVRISDDHNQLLGYNLMHASHYLPELTTYQGQVFLTDGMLAVLNKLIQTAAFSDVLTDDHAPRFVVGYVQTAEPHPDSDHLQVTQTQIGANPDQTVQIVSGSPNMQAGIKVVVAKVGAMMPSGQIIWPGALRGVESDGMIVSGRELALPNAPQRPGALILPADFAPVGTPFDRLAPAAQALFK